MFAYRAEGLLDVALLDSEAASLAGDEPLKLSGRHFRYCLLK